MNETSEPRLLSLYWAVDGTIIEISRVIMTLKQSWHFLFRWQQSSAARQWWRSLMSLTCTLYIDYDGKFMFWGFRHDTKATDRSKPSSWSISQVKSKLGLERDSKLWEIEDILLLLDRKLYLFSLFRRCCIFSKR